MSQRTETICDGCGEPILDELEGPGQISLVQIRPPAERDYHDLHCLALGLALEQRLHYCGSPDLVPVCPATWDKETYEALERGLENSLLKPLEERSWWDVKYHGDHGLPLDGSE